jgi:hypothetical protein
MKYISQFLLCGYSVSFSPGAMASRMGIGVRPYSVSEYSTLGGTTG